MRVQAQCHVLGLAPMVVADLDDDDQEALALIASGRLRLIDPPVFPKPKQPPPKPTRKQA